MDDLLVDFGLDLERRLALVTRLRADFGREHAVDKVERQLGQRYRGERRALDPLLAAPPDGEHPPGPGLAVLARRSAALAPVARRLRAAGGEGQLASPLERPGAACCTCTPTACCWPSTAPRSWS